MTRSLPSSPGKASDRRIDWMISLALRRYLSAPGSITSEGSSRARTSCWVMVEAPRSLVPLAPSAAAAAMAAASKPLFAQKVRSSAVVVASSTSRGTSSKATTCRSSTPNCPSSTVPVRS